ncbi:tRNA (N6-isopentenyl adenosine(37)-C2)-methylthiotransferase MiaB [Candidatus Neomarinimicrobiota bacterium]
MNKSYYIETYGCQMNVADSELIDGILQHEGYKQTQNIDEANVIFINTCAVRDHAEAKVHSRLGNFNRIKKNKPEVIIGMLGCMAQNLKDEILENKPYVDIVLGPDSYRKLPVTLNNRLKEQKHIVDTQLSRFEVYDGLFPSRKEGINAWVSIMRGCDKFCTFCIVPFTRGRERSRSPKSIMQEIERAIKNGFVEVTLLGQNVNSYKHDNIDFTGLLKQISSIPGLLRLRYTSPHPSDVNEELLDVMADSKNICNSIHFPLQAGSDRILRRMNRTYTKNHFLEYAKKIRSIIPGVGISTDIIVGFPGETEEDFQETLEVMDIVKFDSAYTFKYSSRPYTKAIEYDDHIDEDVKKDRLDRLIKLQRQHTLFRNREMIDTVVDVLVEKESKKSDEHWSGRTDSNKWVIFKKDTAKVKDIIPVRITAAHGVTLKGQIEGK